MSSISPLSNTNAIGYSNSSLITGTGNGKDMDAAVTSRKSAEAGSVTGHGARTDAVANKEKVNIFGIKEKDETECQTCANRKYVDGSDEMVSFKAPTQIDPEAAATMVRAHEQEHVSNAYTKAAKGNGEVVSASISIHMDICPECGKPYVSGGTTRTQIRYNNEDNPYEKDRKAWDYAMFGGQNADHKV